MFRNQVRRGGGATGPGARSREARDLRPAPRRPCRALHAPPAAAAGLIPAARPPPPRRARRAAVRHGRHDMEPAGAPVPGRVRDGGGEAGQLRRGPHGEGVAWARSVEGGARRGVRGGAYGGGAQQRRGGARRARCAARMQAPPRPRWASATWGARRLQRTAPGKAATPAAPRFARRPTAARARARALAPAAKNQSKTHAVLATLKRAQNELSSYQRKIFKIDDHMGIAISGLTADGRVLCKYMRNECLNHRCGARAPRACGRRCRGGPVQLAAAAAAARQWPQRLQGRSRWVARRGRQRHSSCPRPTPRHNTPHPSPRATATYMSRPCPSAASCARCAAARGRDVPDWSSPRAPARPPPRIHTPALTRPPRPVPPPPPPKVADKHQVCTQRSWKRPYGVGLLVAGHDQRGPHLYNTCPSGNYWEYKAMAIGARSQVGSRRGTGRVPGGSVRASAPPRPAAGPPARPLAWALPAPHQPPSPPVNKPGLQDLP
jgi:hypothetical protein